MESEEENKILELFLFNYSLKFNEIEKQLKIRSNKLAYHIKNLVKRGVIEKNQEVYSLTKTSKYLIPYLSDKKSVLTIIIIHIGNNKKAFLYTRTKKPFKNKLALPGGRLQVNESISQAVKRIMKEKFNITARLTKIKSISLEHVKDPKNIIHSFLLIFVSAKTKNNKNNIKLKNIESNKNKIISSDYKIIINNLKSKIKINTIYSRD